MAPAAAAVLDITAHCSVVGRADQLEKGQEDLHDVHVEYDGAVDVLLGADLVFPSAHDLLGVVHQVLPRRREKRVKQRWYTHVSRL